MPTLLVIDDEASIRDCLRLTFRGTDVDVVDAGSAAEGLEEFRRCRPDAVLLDVHLPDRSGLEIFQQLCQTDPRVPVLVMTGAGTTGTAIEAMRLGAYEYVLKPLDLEQLRILVHGAIDLRRAMQTRVVVAGSGEPEDGSDVLVGRCPAMQEVYKAVGRVAAQDVTVLILGESGTGKELVARAVYQYSRRAAGPFLALNCAALPEALLESELFGHEKGAFTGADQRRIGKFEQCSGGTLFLDEVGDMPPLTQAKVLRLLQDQCFERVGGNETIRTDVRLVAATNRDLEKLTAAGRFRKDLYYRLNTYAIRLPPLRERAEDLPLLVDHFLRRSGRELGKEVRGVTAEVLELLQRHPWPGNVRELQSVLKQALLQATGPVVVSAFLPAALRDLAPAPAATSPAAADPRRFIEERLRAGSHDLYGEWLREVERDFLAEVLRHTEGNLSQAARLLGLSRPTLRGKLHALGISPGQPVPDNDVPR